MAKLSQASPPRTTICGCVSHGSFLKSTKGDINPPLSFQRFITAACQNISWGWEASCVLRHLSSGEAGRSRELGCPWLSTHPTDLPTIGSLPEHGQKSNTTPWAALASSTSESPGPSCDGVLWTDSPSTAE